MPEMWIELKDFPVEGREFKFLSAELENLFTDAASKAALLFEAGSLSATLWAQVPGAGVSAKGRLAGLVRLPCSRCAEDSVLSFEASFHEHELSEEEEEGPETFDADSHLRHGLRGLEFNIAAFLWEQFMLALPLQPLCSELCCGVCSSCGQNLNKGKCACRQESSDPRLAALQGLKLQ